MSSSAPQNPLKRSRDDDDKDRPFKKQLVEVTGLEADSVVEEITTRSVSTITTSQIDIYVQRRKAASYADAIRRKQAMTKKIRGDWTGMPTSAQQGLKNLTGALCYRLSLLQVLLHQPRFVHWVEDFHRPEHCVSDDRERCVCCCLRTMSLEYWRGTPGGTLKVLQGMHRLFNSLGWSSDSSSGHADPDEMTTWIFATLRAELPSSVYLCLEAMIQPAITATVSCRCGYESKTTGHRDSALPLPIAPAIRNGTVAQYLQQYMVETVEGYRCDGCKNNTTDKHRRQLINYAPEILTIQLKRTDEYGRKLNNHVTINRTLDLTKYWHADNQESLRYELIGVIKHRGTLTLGHYICSVKGPDGNWYEFDDRIKTVSSFAAATSSRDKFTPYLLFFQRED